MTLAERLDRIYTPFWPPVSREIPVETFWIFGSPQEFDGTRILGCFFEDHEFGLGRRHALRLQQ